MRQSHCKVNHTKLKFLSMTLKIVHSTILLLRTSYGTNHFVQGKKELEVCVGDSGSGLYVEVEEVFYLRGIVSSGRDLKCGPTTEDFFAKLMRIESNLSLI